MLISLIVLSVFLFVLFCSFLVLLGAAIKTSRQVQTYEEFYEDSLKYFDEILIMLNDLSGRSQIISDDPEIQMLVKIIFDLKNNILGYKSATKEKEKEKERKQ